MRIVIALGGNALLRRNEPLTVQNQLANIKKAAFHIAKCVPGNQLIITHGNGPQVGLLALQNDAYQTIKPYPLDVLNAETEGMIGYLLEQEMANQLTQDETVVTLLTRVLVDQNDAAFLKPTKPIGPMYSKEEAESLAKERQWTIAVDGSGYRRVVPSPDPQKILGVDPILWLLEKKVIVIAAGGGGIPIAEKNGTMIGVEAVIDKDLCSALLAQEVHADCLLIVTDVDAVYVDWGKPTQSAIQKITSRELQLMAFPAGSMGPKIKAACQFVEATKKMAVIGALDQIEAMLQGVAGTKISFD